MEREIRYAMWPLAQTVIEIRDGESPDDDLIRTR
jgi:hypothetical protein